MPSPGVSERRTPNTKGSTQTRKQIAQAPPRLFNLRAGVPWWLRVLKSNPDDASVIIGEYLDAPADDVKEMMAGVTIYGVADNKRLFGTEDAPVDFAVGSKLIDNAPPIDSLLDPQLIRDAR